MSLERPDLSQVSDEVRAYIEGLEAELLQLKVGKKVEKEAPPPEPSEPPTTINVITISQSGLVKRTPRHFYGRQRRGGMGVFDLDIAEDDPPTVLATVDEDEDILLFSNFGRVFRLGTSKLFEAAVRAKGYPLANWLPFRPHECIVAVLPADKGEYVALSSQRGWARRIPAARLDKNMIPGMSFYDVQQGGYVTDACWTMGAEQLFMATRSGKGIRFSESQVHKQGSLGIRVDLGDQVVAITAVTDDSGVFLASHDGKGTIRQMAGFRANKAPGAAGKVAMKTDYLVAAITVNDDDDIFMISKSSKIIRFPADNVPPKTGVVQGVNCMSLRSDEVTAVGSSQVAL